MFAAGSIKSSKWGWDIKTYPFKYGDTTSTQASNVGYFTGGCLAPNGLIYCLPTYKGAQFVTVIKPGKSNSKTGKWEPATITNVPSLTSGAKTPSLPDITDVNSVLQRRFANKGILAPNGLIYFFGFIANGYVVVKPQDDPDFNITQFTEWKVVTYASVGLQPVANASGYGGGFLHTDGKIYLLPQYYGTYGSSAAIARITPRSDYQSADTIQKSAYWNPLPNATNDVRRYFPTGAVNVSGIFSRPVNIDGTEITPIPADTHGPTYNSTNGGIGSMPTIGDAISHPNGNIYIFGGARNAYVLKVKTDDATWNSNSNVTGNILYTSNALRVPNKLPNGYTGTLGLQGSFMSGSIEKLKLGQNPITAKIYLHYAGAWINDSSITTVDYFQNNYTRTIVFDPETETFENIGEPVTTKVTDQQPWSLKPPIKMANGHTFNVSIPYATGGSAAANKNLYGQLIVSGEISNTTNKIIGPTSTRSLLNTIENKNLSEGCYGNINPVTNQGSHALTGSSLGKTFVTAPWAAFEITSVKGFYPGIKYFNYKGNTGANFTSKLKTHTGVTIVSKNQIKLLGVDLVSSLSVGSKFVLSNTANSNDGAYTITNRTLSGSDTLITVSQTTLNPIFSTYIEGLNFISSTEVQFSGFYPELNAPGVKIYISDSSLGNDDYYTNTSYLYLPPNTTLIYSAASFNTGVDSTARLYYKDPVNDDAAILTYGQLVEFPNDETLRIYGVDLTNSMYQVQYVNVQGSSVSGNNGAKQIYTGSTPFYDNGYTDLTFMPGTFTQVAPEAGVTMSYQYAFNDSDIYDIPSDLSDLPTSLYNAYHNKPR
jgi:hypothetical protein